MTEQEAREVRNEALASTDYLMMPDYPLTPAGKMILGIYRQKLRDWPETEGFPDPTTMPEPEDWKKYKAQEQIGEPPNELTD